MRKMLSYWELSKVLRKSCILHRLFGWLFSCTLSSQKSKSMSWRHTWTRQRLKKELGFVERKMRKIDFLLVYLLVYTFSFKISKVYHSQNEKRQNFISSDFRSQYYGFGMCAIFQIRTVENTLIIPQVTLSKILGSFFKQVTVSSHIVYILD